MPAEIVLQSLRHIWTTLRALKVPVAVMGGLALATWKCVRATRDVDLLIGVGDGEPDQLLKSLQEAGLRPKRQPPVIRLGELDVLQLLYEPPEAFVDLQIDLLLAKSPYHRTALDRRIPARLADLDVEIAVLTCEDLILHKLLAGRILDRADCIALVRANRTSLDIDYLAHWAGALGLTADLNAIWNEATPSETAPFAP